VTPSPNNGDAAAHEYRLRALESWKDTMEQNRLPTELALHDARLRAVELMVTKQDALLTELVKRDNERTGWWAGNKAIITVVGFFLLQVISVAVILSDKLG
jgi:hypothetical protein